MDRTRWLAIAFGLGICTLPVAAAGWSPKLAAQFLDERQKQWFAWPGSAKPGGPCVSCHTGLPYLMVRPALRQALGETEPTEWETGYRKSLQARVNFRQPKDLGYEKEPTASQAIGVEAIFAALLIPSQVSWQRLWDLQVRDGNARGGWNWFELERDPWENTDSPFFGSALIALALKDGNQDRQRAAALAGYLNTAAPDQPLQNRLAVLWTARTLPGAFDATSRRKWIEEAFSKQSPDGGWSNEALGPWKQRPEAVAVKGSASYPTAFAAYALLEAGVPASDPHLVSALAWLRTHQNPESGYWDGVSMNKRYPAGSMPEQFMRDAATAFAAAALLKAQ